ncbi:amidase [Acetobacter senegalensis]|uniref:Amidase n=1 Tax=Acetobacter senegalensis TaxID=446692 RepID=A0A0U4Y1C2_9PROT|nr:amidase [Acetobacter senegalensis]CEF40702.1 amidase [Acetobacter senegalensis]
MSETRATMASKILNGIEKYEPQLKAFTSYDPVRIRQDADMASPGPLLGMSVGVKDIIDTVHYPTSHGSPIYAGYHSLSDAACVTQLKTAGAVCVGKTVTTEFAFFSPGPTVNPYDVTRTPGGSSSGSAAAVAVGMVDIGLASQTAASLTRPASYCGIVGFKPSYGRYAAAGIKSLAPSFDTLGTMTRDVATAALADGVLKGPTAVPSTFKPRRPSSIGICRTPHWDAAEEATQKAIEKAAALFSKEVQVTYIDLEDFAEAADLHITIMSYEAAQALGWEYADRRPLLSSQIVGLLEAGKQIDYATYRAALARAEELRCRMADIFANYDVLVAPAAPGEAPLAESGTGSPLFSRLWTLLRLPTVTLPGLTSSSGLPVGVQLLSAYGTDEDLLNWAGWAETILPPRPLPSMCT